MTSRTYNRDPPIIKSGVKIQPEERETTKTDVPAIVVGEQFKPHQQQIPQIAEPVNVIERQRQNQMQAVESTQASTRQTDTFQGLTGSSISRRNEEMLEEQADNLALSRTITEASERSPLIQTLDSEVSIEQQRPRSISDPIISGRGIVSSREEIFQQLGVQDSLPRVGDANENSQGVHSGTTNSSVENSSSGEHPTERRTLESFEQGPQGINSQTGQSKFSDGLGNLLDSANNELLRKSLIRFGQFKIANLKSNLENEYLRMKNGYVRGDLAKRFGNPNQVLGNSGSSGEIMRKLNFVHLNADMPPRQNLKQHNLKKVYLGASQQCRQEVTGDYLRRLIKKGTPFICLVEVYSAQMRKIVLQVVQTTTTSKGQYYYYPEHLEKEGDSYTTIILSKFDVRFGRIKFLGKHPEQTFCEFEVVSLDGKRVETVCIVCCHWKSTRKSEGQLLEYFRRIRQEQKKCTSGLQKLRKYYAMSVVGDTNLDLDETLENDEFFIDTYFQSRQENHAPESERISKHGGTYLLIDKDCKIIYVRPDRVLVNRESQDRVRVKTKIHDLFLQGLGKYKKLQEIILTLKHQSNKQLTYLRPFDHFILRGAMHL